MVIAITRDKTNEDGPGISRCMAGPIIILLLQQNVQNLHLCSVISLLTRQDKFLVIKLSTKRIINFHDGYPCCGAGINNSDRLGVKLVNTLKEGHCYHVVLCII